MCSFSFKINKEQYVIPISIKIKILSIKSDKYKFEKHCTQDNAKNTF